MRIWSFLPTLAAIYICEAPGLVSGTAISDGEMTTANQWVAARLGVAGESSPPSGFIYDGKPSAGLLPSGHG
jgi:hypothetical protein